MEINILLFIQEHIKNDILDFVIPKISFLSDTGWIWILTAVVLLFLKKYRRYGIALSIGLVFCGILGNLILKPLVARVRPYDVYTDINLLVEKLNDFSFPSGHTYSAFCGAVVLLAANKKIGYFALVLAILTAFSRLYLFVHYPSDVLVGMIMGVGLAFLSLYLVKLFERRKLNKA